MIPFLQVVDQVFPGQIGSPADLELAIVQKAVILHLYKPLGDGVGWQVSLDFQRQRRLDERG